MTDEGGHADLSSPTETGSETGVIPSAGVADAPSDLFNRVGAKVMRLFVIPAAAMLMAVGPVAGDSRQLAALMPAEVQRRTIVSDDRLEAVATISTVDAFVERTPLLGVVPSDVFLRAFVDKARGRALYQVYVMARYRGLVWADYAEARYETPTGSKGVRLTGIARIKASCRRGYACPRSETLGFGIDEALLRGEAAGYVPGAITPWVFKIKARVGEDQVLILSAAEIAGLLMAVDAYRKDHHLPMGRR